MKEWTWDTLGMGGDSPLPYSSSISTRFPSGKGNAAFPGTGSETVTACKVRNTASLHTRLDYAQDKTLFHVTDDFAQGRIASWAYDSTPPAMMGLSKTGIRSVRVIGLGVQQEIARSRHPDISMLHYDFGKSITASTAIDPSGVFPRFEHDVATGVLRIGMNWHFRCQRTRLCGCHSFTS